MSEESGSDEPVLGMATELEFLELLLDKLIILAGEVAVQTPITEMILMVRSRILRLQRGN